jgi:gliding motility-associated-like protein
MKKIVVFLSLVVGWQLAVAQDLSVVFITAPSTACGHTNSETVTIQLFNAGGVRVKPPYTITYRVNGGLPVVQAAAAGDSIDPGNFLFKSFATTVNMSTPGIYNFQAYVTVPGDIDFTNDTATKVVSSDANTIPGTASADDTVCATGNGGTIVLDGELGNVTGWVRTNSGGSTILGVTDTFLVYSNLTETTSFAAIVRNGTCPFDTSTPAVITVDSATIPGTITGPAAVCIGSSGALNITGSRGNVLDWETATSPGGPWTGATNTTTTFNYTNIQATDDTLFRAILKLGVCPADTTPVKTLNLDLPSIGGTIAQTVGSSPVCAGANSGTLTLSGHRGTVVEWQTSTGGGPFISAGGGGSATFNFTNLAVTTTFRALVQNGTCTPIASATIQIVVDQNSVGGTISNDATVCTGSNFGTLNLSGHVGNVVRWDSSNIAPGGPFSPITNTTTTQNYSNLTVTTYYRAVVQNGVCPSITSATATITVNSPSDGGSITAGGATTVCSGNNTDMLTVAGINGTIQQWELSTNNGASWTNTGISTNTLTYNNLTTTSWYRVAVQNGACPVAYSDTMIITVVPSSASGTISGPANVCVGATANLVLGGSNGTVTKWRISTNAGASYTDVAGSAGLTTISPTITTTSQFIAIVQLGVCDPDTTTPFVVNSNLTSVGGTAAPDATICSGDNANVTLAGHTGNVLRWETSQNNGATWTNIGGAGSTNLITPPLTDTTLVRAIVQSGTCPIDSSTPATINVIPAAVGGTASVAAPNDTVCEGAHSVVVNLSGQVGNIVTWESSTGGGPFVDEGVSGLPQAFSKTFTANTLFRAVIQNGAGCPTVTSVTGSVIVNPTTVGGSISAASTTVCGGSNSGTINLTGHVGSVVRWEQATNFGAFTPVVPANTTTSLSYSGLNDTTQYRVVVKSGECGQEFSDTALIQIIPAAIGGQVTGAPATPLCASDTNLRTLTLVGSSGTILNWQRSPNGSAWTGIGNGGSTTLNYRASTLAGTSYFRARLSDGACPVVFSTPDTVFLDPLSDAGTANGATAHCDTGNSGFVFITGFTGNVVKWQQSTNGVTFTDVAASANDTIFYNNLLDTTHYRAIVQNGACGEDTSNVVVITVSPDVVAGTLSGGTSYCAAINTTLLQLTGYTGGVVKWQQSINAGPFTDIANTDDTLRVNNVTQNTTYRVIVASGTCGSDTSNTTSILVGLSDAGTIAGTATYCDTINHDTLFLNGFVGAILNWQSSTDGVTFTNVVPANTSDTLVYTNLTDTTYFRAIVKSATCPEDTSDTATIFVDPLAIGGLLSASKSFCDTFNSDTLILTGFQGNITNWEASIDTGKTWVPFAPAYTNDSLFITDLKQTTQFRVVVSNPGSCPDSLSNVVVIAIGPAQAGTISGTDTLCSGLGVDTLWLANNVGDSIVWQSSPDSLAWTNTGSDTTFQSVNGITATTYYRVLVFNDTCGSDTSAGFRVEAIPQTVAGTITGDDRVCFNDTALKTLTLGGHIGNVLFWESRDTAAAWTNIPNTTTSQTYKNLTLETTFRAIVDNGVCPADTASITVFIDSLSKAGTLFGIDTVCAGTNTGVVYTDTSQGITYLWESSTNGGANWNIEPSVDTFLVYNDLTDTTVYRVIVTNGGCPADTSNTVEVVVKPAAVAGVISSDSSFCEGPNAGTLTLSGNTGTIIDWEFAEGSGAFTSTGNTLPSLAYNNVTQTTRYRVIVSLGDCPNDTTPEATITIVPTPVVSISGDGPLTFCEGGSVVLTATGGPAYAWSTGATDSAITVSATGTYSVVVTDTSNNLGCSAEDSISVSVFDPPTVVALRDTTIQLGEEVMLTATGALTYVWSPSTGLDNAVATNPFASPDETTTYVLTGTDANGCTGVDSLVVTVDTDLTPDFTNLFTPDGDGINDTWTITGLAGCNSCALKVFNRYGQEVYSASNYQNDWRGTFDGKDLPDGTYYFILESNDTQKTYKGAVTLLRGE